MNTMAGAYVLIDVSYYEKYASFAAWKRLKEDTGLSDSPDTDPMRYPKFVEYLSGHFNFGLSDIIGKYYPMHNHSNFIFCIDCERNQIWRKDVFPGYKHKRDSIIHKFDSSGVHLWISEWIKSHNSKYGSRSIGVPYAEADDVISVLSKELIRNDDELDVLIISGDSDLLQLGNDRVFQINSFGEIQSIEQKLSKDKVEFEPTPSNYLVYKVLCGDHSDDIPSVKHGKCGPKKAASLINDKQKLNDYIKSELEISEAFLRNYNLISLNKTPKLIVESIIREWQNAAR